MEKQVTQKGKTAYPDKRVFVYWLSPKIALPTAEQQRLAGEQMKIGLLFDHFARVN